MLLPNTRFRLGLALLCGGSLFLCGCVGSKPFVWPEPTKRLVWPAPPETPRLRYLHAFSNPADLRGEEQRDNPVIRWLLGKTAVDLPLATPYAVAVDGSDVLWVADSGSHLLYRFDLARGKVDYIRDVGNIALLLPIGVAVDPVRQRVFVADSGLGKLLVLDSHGRLLAEWAPPGGFGRPAGLALDRAGQLYVTDVVQRQVFVFGADGTLVARRGSKLTEDGRFGRPVSVAIGPANELLVLDVGMFRVEVQNSQGELLRKFGQLGDVPGAFARPRSIAVNSQGLVLVSDAAFDNVQIFDLAGQLLLYFGVPGKGAGQFNLPAGVSFDSEGRIFVADTFNSRIQVFQLLPAAEGIPTKAR